MQYVYVTSARRNPEQNVRVTREEQLTRFYELDKQYDLPTYFVSYTQILKLGINPSSLYDTPLGIYTYPLRYLFKDLVQNTVPFAKGRPYLQIVKRTSNNVLYPETFTRSDYDKATKQLERLFAKNRNKVNSTTLESLYRLGGNKESDETATDYNNLTTKEIVSAVYSRAETEYERLLNDSERKQAPRANDISDFKWTVKFWVLSKIYAQLLANRTNTRAVGSKSAQVWRTILVSLGYDCAVDPGFGYIHPNEPTQAVFFTKAALQTVDTINNEYGKNKSVTKPKEIRRFVNLTEKSYARLIKQFPILADVTGYGIYVSLDEATKRLTFSPAAKDYKGRTDYSKAYLSCSKPIRNVNIDISCKNCTLQNCTIQQSYCEKCTIQNCKFDDLVITDSEIQNSTGKYLEYNRSKVENCDITGKLTSHVHNSFSYLTNCTIQTLASAQDDRFRDCKIEKVLGINRYTNFSNCHIELIKPNLTSLENCNFENCSWGKSIDFANPEYQNFTSMSDNGGKAVFVNCNITDFYAELAEINPTVLELRDCESIELSEKRGKVVIVTGQINSKTLRDFYIRYPELSNCTVDGCIFEQPSFTGEEGKSQHLTVTHSTLNSCNIDFARGSITQTRIVDCNISNGYFYTGNKLDSCIIKGGYFYNDYKRHKESPKQLFYGDPYVLISNCTISPYSDYSCVFERAHFVSCDLSSVDIQNNRMFINCKFD